MIFVYQFTIYPILLQCSLLYVFSFHSYSDPVKSYYSCLILRYTLSLESGYYCLKSRSKWRFWTQKAFRSQCKHSVFTTIFDSLWETDCWSETLSHTKDQGYRKKWFHWIFYIFHFLSHCIIVDVMGWVLTSVFLIVCTIMRALFCLVHFAISSTQHKA